MLQAGVDDSIQDVVSVRWTDNAQVYPSLNPLVLPQREEGAYSLSLDATTQFGCSTSTVLLYYVIPQPELFYNIDQTFGAVPAEPEIKLLGGLDATVNGIVIEGDTSFGTEHAIPISEPAEIEGVVFAINTTGCVSQKQFKLNFTNPQADLSVTGLERIVASDATMSIKVRLLNSGIAPIGSSKIVLSALPEYQLAKTIEQLLEPGMETTVSFEGLIFQEDPSAYCVQVLTVNDMPDTITVNNERCISAKEDLILSVFPNPAAELLNVVLNGSIGEEVDISILNQTGDWVWQTTLATSSQTALKTTLDLRALRAGVYIIAAYSADQAQYVRFVKY